VNLCSFVAGWAKAIGKGCIPAVDVECVRELVVLRGCVQGIVDGVLSAARKEQSLFEMEGEDGGSTGR
jgi:hypothetical protein